MFLIANVVNRSSKVFTAFLIDDIPIVAPQGACVKFEFIIKLRCGALVYIIVRKSDFMNFFICGASA